MSFSLYDVEAIKTVMIFHSYGLTAGTSFSQNVYIPFTPDFVRVKNVLYNWGVNDIDNMYLISCDAINPGNPIANFCINLNSNPVAGAIISINPPQEESIYMLRKPVSGDLGFQINTSLGGGTANLNGSISFQLEFVKLKVAPPQKVF